MKRFDLSLRVWPKVHSYLYCKKCLPIPTLFCTVWCEMQYKLLTCILLKKIMDQMYVYKYFYDDFWLLTDWRWSYLCGNPACWIISWTWRESIHFCDIHNCLSLTYSTVAVPLIFYCVLNFFLLTHLDPLSKIKLVTCLQR